MKSIITLVVICLIAGFTTCHGQNEIKADTAKQMNLIDEQVKILNSAFEMGSTQGNPLGSATNYYELLENSEMDPELKKELYEQYKIYDLSLDPKKKDSLKIMVNKMLQKALDKSKTDSKL